MSLRHHQAGGSAAAAQADHRLGVQRTLPPQLAGNRVHADLEPHRFPVLLNQLRGWRRGDCGIDQNVQLAAVGVVAPAVTVAVDDSGFIEQAFGQLRIVIDIGVVPLLDERLALGGLKLRSDAGQGELARRAEPP